MFATIIIPGRVPIIIPVSSGRGGGGSFDQTDAVILCVWLGLTLVCWPIYSLMFYRAERAERYTGSARETAGFAMVFGLLCACLGPLGLILVLGMTGFAKGGIFRQKA